MYKLFIRPILFLFPPETVHRLAVFYLRFIHLLPILPGLIKKALSVRNPQLQRQLLGLNFENPVGLAAGFDKNAELIDELSAFGFGFIEIGTVTPRAQPGNKKPRLFRLPVDKALINRMGFNNNGVDYVKRNLKKRRSGIIVGGNIGKNKSTANDNAIDDYLYCLSELYDLVDYFVVNVSSPNTPELRKLQDREPLMELLKVLQEEIRKKGKRKPLLLKIAPDLSYTQLDDIIDICNTLQLDGIVAVNTTIEREGLQTESGKLELIGEGGLSGKPLNERSNEVIRYLRQKLDPDIIIIGVGGIMNKDQVMEKMKAGASLVQIYTGFIYEGPDIVRKINLGLLQSGEYGNMASQ